MNEDSYTLEALLLVLGARLGNLVDPSASPVWRIPFSRNKFPLLQLVEQRIKGPGSDPRASSILQLSHYLITMFRAVVEQVENEQVEEALHEPLGHSFAHGPIIYRNTRISHFDIYSSLQQGVPSFRDHLLLVSSRRCQLGPLHP